VQFKVEIFKVLKMTGGMEKSGKILENCDADLENADVRDTTRAFATFLAFHETQHLGPYAKHS